MTNPFMVTSNECYGMSLAEVMKRASYPSPFENTEKASSGPDEEGGTRPVATPTEAGASPATSRDLSFLYSRESDRFGEGIRPSDSTLSRVLRLADSDPMRKRRRGSALSAATATPRAAPASRVRPRDEVEDLLSRYEHRPKEQNPLYATTANEYGAKRPAAATCPTVSHGNSQRFSRSFNRTMFRDEGLNSSMTKSKIHDSLTSQFA